MIFDYIASRIEKFLNTWSPLRLRKKIRAINKEKEFHAFSVRQMIAQRARLFELIELIGRLSKFEDGGSVEPVANQVRKTESQFYQDILGLLLARGKKGGYFVEFGACDWVRISNTYVLEKSFGWTGILAEPGREWHEGLKKNRSCHLETMCVWSRSGEKIPFYEADQNQLQSSAEADHMHIDREALYQVETISLYDMLKKYNAPQFIDFMSIDVEGSEFKILENFPFDSYRFGLMCVEHHLPQEEERIKNLMDRNGYKQVFRSVSDFDGWYVPKSVAV